jgi:peptidoglycan/LPS O-acetylase OafA/YrhL
LDSSTDKNAVLPILKAQLPGSSSRVRNDIEGLRALAVLAVVAHHAFPSRLPGGFAGVDMFFVISGYLIGGHLLQDIQAERFSIRSFYAKRARRIFPALTLVLIAVWGVGWIAFSAPEFAALGRHVAAAALFSNNILLWSESGYFDVASIDKPLLHLWSLGIEEQFYLVVPLLLWLSKDHANGSVRWVAWLGGLSLLTTVFLSNLEYAATFYLLHARFWELACGVLLAQAELRLSANAPAQASNGFASKRYMHEILLFSIAVIFLAILQLGLGAGPRRVDAILSNTACALLLVVGLVTAIGAHLYSHPDSWNGLLSWASRRRPRLAAASSVLGILLICASLATLSSASWPGPRTLFPVLGAVLVIAAGPTMPWPNKLLGTKPLAFIGGISYPLYLWHWPVMVFWRQMNPVPRPAELVTPLIASFALAWLTKEVVENPIRFGKLGLTKLRRPPLWPVASGLALTGLVGLAVAAGNGWPARFSPELRAIAEWSQSNPGSEWRVGRCYLYPGTNSNFAAECTPLRRPGVPLTLIWGDSHAAHLYPGLASIQSSADFDIAQWTAAGCPPSITALVGESQNCSQRRATVLRELPKVDPDVVLLSGAWERYQELGRPPGEILGLMAGTIRYLKSRAIKRIVVFGPGPLWNVSLPVDLFRFMARARSNKVPNRLGSVPEAIWQLDAAMAAQAAAADVEYVSVLNFFCDRSGCLTLGDRTLTRPDLLFRDRDHLTVTGSRVLMQHARAQLFGASTRGDVVPPAAAVCHICPKLMQTTPTATNQMPGT